MRRLACWPLCGGPVRAYKNPSRRAGENGSCLGARSRWWLLPLVLEADWDGGAAQAAPGWMAVPPLWEGKVLQVPPLWEVKVQPVPPLWEVKVKQVPPPWEVKL